MFTGLIEETGRVARVVRAGDGINLTIDAVKVLDGIETGDSVCINGACQTVTAADGSSFSVFVSAVTASVTTLGAFTPGRRVNLERAMTPGSRFGGHFVQGHVDGRGGIARVDKGPAGMNVAVSVPAGLRRYIVEKGSIAVDGVSLTVVSLTGNGFTLYFIPETLANTIVSEWKAGDEVNIEVDVIAKYVERMMESGTSGGGDESLMKKLAEEGFA
ncbi:MAG: riboflavin synthase [Spirochaetes bacterium]|nr:riboflavin synthase [Spirochaetota bacterium]